MLERDNKPLEEAKNALTEGIAKLKPAPIEPDGNAELDIITFDNSEKDNAKWKTLLAEHLKRSSSFEIHCWSGEAHLIDLALQYGDLKEDGWEHGKIVAGAVTPELAAMLLGMQKPEDNEGYNKMTPFFNIFLDSGFSSSHYGTEIYISK